MPELPEPLSPSARLPWEAETVVKPAGEGLPGVSVVMPIYNAGAFLEKSIRSLLTSDLSGVELILIDGGSTDNTRDIAEHYKAFFAHMVFEKDDGQSDAINKGFERASKDILYWLNGDDILLPNALTDVRAVFRDHPDTHVVVGDAYLTEKNFDAIRHFQFSPDLLRFDSLIDYAKNHLVQPSVFFTREAWKQAGPLANDLHYAMDADLFLGMASKFTFRHLPLDLAFSVYHEDCKTRGKRAESITELALVQAKHGGHAEARNTLNILVGMFNETAKALSDAEARAAAAEAAPDTPEQLYDRKLAAMRAEIEANKQILLDRDLLETRAS